MNAIVYVVAVIAIIGGIASVLAVWLSIRRLRRERDFARDATQDALDRAARDIIKAQLPTEQVQEMQPHERERLAQALAAEVPTLADAHDEREWSAFAHRNELSMAEDRAARVRRDFLSASVSVQARRREPEKRAVGDIPLDVYATVPEVRRNVLGMLRLLYALERSEPNQVLARR